MKKLWLLTLMSGVAFGIKVKQTAVIIPYAQHQGKTYLLLGKERSSGNWCGFGGLCDQELMLRIAWQGDQLYYRCAAREATEETKSIFGLYLLGKRDGELLAPLSQRQANEAAKKSMQFFRMKSAQTPYTISRLTHRDYFVEVPYIEAHIFDRAPKTRNSEKKAYRWVPAEDFVREVRQANLHNLAQRSPGWMRYHGLPLRRAFATTIASNEMQGFIQQIVGKKTERSFGVNDVRKLRDALARLNALLA